MTFEILGTIVVMTFLGGFAGYFIRCAQEEHEEN